MVVLTVIKVSYAQMITLMLLDNRGTEFYWRLESSIRIH